MCCGSRHAGSRWRGRDGFTLIEALVAFTVLALLMVALQRGVGASATGMTRAQDRAAAELVARTLMTAPLTAVDLERGRDTGSLEGRDWRRTLTPIAPPASAALATAAQGASADDEGSSGPSAAQEQAWVPVRTRIEVETGARGGFLAIETVRVIRIGEDR